MEVRMTRKMEALQPLSTLNTLFLFLAELVNGNSCEMIVINGDVDAVILGQAMQDVVAAHPHLRTHIVKKGRRYYKAPVSEPLQIPIEKRCFTGGADELNRFLSDNIWCTPPVDVFKGPPLRIVLTQAGRQTHLQILSSHVWSDAKAGYALMNDIVEAYTCRMEGRQPQLSQRENCGLDFDESLQARLAAIGRVYSRKVVLKSLYHDLFHSGGSTTVKRADRYQSRFITTGIGDNAFMRQLKQASKAAGVTIHSFLVAALTRALHQHDERLGSDKSHYRLHDMLSLRDHVDGFEEIYDCCVLPFDFDCNWHPASDARLVSNSHTLAEIKQGRIFDEYFKVRFMLDLLHYLPRPLASRLALRYLVNGNVLCTNPGIIPFDYPRMAKAPVTDFYSFSQVFPPGHLMFVFTTFRQSFRLATVYNEFAVTAAEVQTIINDVVTELHCMIAESALKQSVAEPRLVSIA